MIPIAVLTGFLGSGKTTLLDRLLRHPGFARTAVIINEFGDVGIDHELVATSEESFVTLETGCLCCTIRGDLVLTLEDLLRRRDAGQVPAFERVVIETTGLADPAPILQALMTDQALAERLRLAGVAATADAALGLATLERHPEAVKQAALADRLIITKTDLPAAATEALEHRLRGLNPAAPILRASFGALDPERLFDAGLHDPAGKLRDIEAWLAAPDSHHHHTHDHSIASFCLLRDQPLHAVTLSLLLETLAEHRGADLLRVKGLINLVESPDRPAVFHGVQHVVHPPAFLERWPTADRRSRLVFIVRDVPQSWVECLLDALEAEVSTLSSGSWRGDCVNPS